MTRLVGRAVIAASLAAFILTACGGSDTNTAVLETVDPGAFADLAETEDRMNQARQAYNGDVLQLNNKVEMFPSNIIAGMFNFDQAEFFEIADEEVREAPKVSF